MLGDVGRVCLDGICWVVIGEETGPEAALHAPDPGWAWGIVRQAVEAGVPVSIRPPMSERDGMPSMDGMPPAIEAASKGLQKPIFPTFESLLSI